MNIDLVRAESIVRDWDIVSPDIFRFVRIAYGEPDKIKLPPSETFVEYKTFLDRIFIDPIIMKGEEDREGRPFEENLSIAGIDTVVALILIHEVCKKVAIKGHGKGIQSIIQNGILRARIGYYLGACSPDFGAGRGLLAGFAKRMGLALLIAFGSEEKAEEYNNALIENGDTDDTVSSVYGASSSEIGALSLVYSGVSAEAGIYLSQIDDQLRIPGFTYVSQKWLCTSRLVEHLRFGQLENVDARLWEQLEINEHQLREALCEEVRELLRVGHGWNWLQDANT